MVRSKGNIVVKDKNSASTTDLIKTTKLYANKFPLQNESEYQQCRYLISDVEKLRNEI